MMTDKISKHLAAECIAAFATPPGQSALAVLRLSGPVAFELADRLFEPAKGFPRAKDMDGYTMAYGHWLNPEGERVDEVMIAAFRAPKSYTGENLFEISCHGGLAPRKAILQSLLDLGVSPAGPGEFTRRAFLNGKLDLSQAEGIMDMISAVSERQGQLAIRQRDGSIKREIQSLSSALYRALSHVEMVLEFPDEEGAKLTETLKGELAAAQEEMDRVLASYRQGKAIREGFRVTIAGRANAGKSSLLNALMGEDRAIVTDIAGTTRDTLDAMLDLDGIPVNLTDTAGLRDSDDVIEREGISRARRAMADADLVLWLLSPMDQTGFDEEFAEIDKVIERGTDLVLLLGKDDLVWPEDSLETVEQRFPDTPKQPFSMFDKRFLQDVRDLIRERFEALAPEGEANVLLSNARQKAALDRTAELLGQARETLDAGLPLELTASLLRAAIDKLAEITGENVSEELIEQIFQRFCVGK